MSKLSIIINRTAVKEILVGCSDDKGVYVIISVDSENNNLKKTLRFPSGIEKHVKAIRTLIQTTFNNQLFIDIENLTEGIQLSIDKQIKADKDYEEAHD